MSYYTKKPTSMHSSQIISKQQQPSSQKQLPDNSKLSQFYTKASSQFGSHDNHQYANIIENYQSRMSNMQSGFERSKQQFENSLKQMYREKIILLNIISHNQELVDEFRSKVRINPQVNFKEVETKYNIISSGLFHNQLCQHCIMKLSKTDIHSNKGVQSLYSHKTADKQRPRNPQTSTHKKVDISMSLARQYSWMYAPNQDFKLILAKIKHENLKLKNSIEELNLENSFRVKEKNKQIQHLKAQISKIHANSSKILHTSQAKQLVCFQGRQKCQKSRELLMKSQTKLEELKANKIVYEQIIKQLNEKIVATEIDRLNSKYRVRYL